MGDQKPLVWYFPKVNSMPRRETAALKPQGGTPIGQRPPEQKASSQGMPAKANPKSDAVKGAGAGAPLPSEPADLSPLEMAKMAVQKIQNGERKRLKALWIETSGCFAEFVAMLNGSDPDILYWLTQMVGLTFFASIMADQGELAYQDIVNVVESGEEYLLVVSGAIPLAQGGHCAVIAKYEGRLITAEEAVKYAAAKARDVFCIGTCACYGGPTAASPNETEAVDVKTLLNREVIRAPGCPCHPEWALGIFAYLVNFGQPPVDEEGRPLVYYGNFIHTICPRRSFFDMQDFASKFGSPECMFALGCRGPITKTSCPFTRWNNSNNWPIGANTTCIGCANSGFPDKMEPFVTYSTGGGAEDNDEDVD